MATCKLLVIHGGSRHLGAALTYARTIEKTVEQRFVETSEEIDYTRSALDYALDASKTTFRRTRYASGIGVFRIDHAVEEFRDTWKRFGKGETGRAAYHLIQSFSPEDEITPEMAQQIGREMVERLFPGHQAVIGTHLDKAHTHNHIIINAVSSIDGRRLHFQKSFLNDEIRRQSDELCRQHGLHVIKPDPDKMRSSYKTGSYRGSLLRDLNYCLGQTKDLAQAVVLLEDYGYEVDTTRKWIRVKPPGAERWIRIDDSQDDRPEVRHIKGALRAKDPTFKRRRKSDSLSGWQAGMLQYVVILGQQQSNRRVFIAVDEYRRFQRHLDELQYIASNGIRSQTELHRRQEDVEKRQAELKRQRYKLIGTKRRMSRLYEADRVMTNPQLHSEVEVRKSQGILERTDLSRQQIRTSRLQIEQGLLDIREESERLRQEMDTIKGIQEAQPKMRVALAKETQTRNPRWVQNRSDDRTQSQTNVPNCDDRTVPSVER